MVEVRVAKLSFEGMAYSPPRAGVQRIAAEAAAEDSGSDEVRVASLRMEVMAKSPTTFSAHRISIEAAAEDSGSDEVRIAAMRIGVMAKLPASLALHRIGVEAAAEDSGSDAVNLAALRIEVMAKVGVPAPVPLDLQSPPEFFANNWEGARAQLSSAYLTDITRSPETLTEERRSLAQRPARVMTVKWTHWDVADMDRLMVFLRNTTQTQMQLPLYPDGTPLTEDALSVATIIKFDNTRRRFFIGGRIILVPTTALKDRTSSPIVKVIEDLIDGQITLTTTIGQDVDSGKWMIFPYIDCDIHLGPQLVMPTDRSSSVTLTFTEHKGRNSLPPVAIGLPSGWQVAPDGKPIFNPEHNWEEDVTVTYRRYGSTLTSGRKALPTVDGERYVQVHSYSIRARRADYWPVLEMFDTRRGRGRAFWAIDRENIWTLSDTDPGFIDVLQFGTFSDFNQDWVGTGLAACIVMLDGTIYLREINTVQDNGGSWRLTLVGGQILPDPIDLTQVDYFARARHSRFEEDAIEELWYTDDVVDASFTLTEIPNEATLDLDP